MLIVGDRGIHFPNAGLLACGLQMLTNLGNPTEALCFLFISGEVLGECFGDVFSKDFGNSFWIKYVRAFNVHVSYD